MTRFNPSDPEPQPTSPSYPDGWQDLMISYALQDLTPDEEQAFQQLLTDHPELQAELTAYQAVLEALPYTLAPQSPSANLEQRILQQAAEFPKQQPAPQTTSDKGAAPASSPTRRRRRWPPVWQSVGTIAAVTLIAFGIDNLRLRHQLSQTQAENTELQQQVQTFQIALDQSQSQAADNEVILTTLRQPNALVYSLQGTENADSASGSLLALPGHSEVVLVSHNLPILPDSQVYRLWALETSTSAPTYCGQFNNTDTGTVQWQLPKEMCSHRPTQMIITVDQVTDPPIPKGPAILQSSL